MSSTDAHRSRAALTLAALGIVYGDIGTSPLYALRECFLGVVGVPVDAPNVLGILSLVTWALVAVISVKYLTLVLRADNEGQGGILALSHLLVPPQVEDWTSMHWLTVGMGLFGASLLFGDGIITPALSVLSAVEGLKVAAPGLQPLIVPIAIAILVGLFLVQRFGTSKVGQVFGPIALLWFVTLAWLGLRQVWAYPQVLVALNPSWAWAFFQNHGWHGTVILGAVFLAVTGGEALYADLGHFGPGPIRRSWFGLVFPGLLLNYFGQGALLLQSPDRLENLFYNLSPPWALYPLVLLATLATVIASQAVISGVFSLTSQAVQMGYFPRTTIQHTSSTQRGQIYVPVANGFLFVGTLGLVLWFRSSSALADAYGIAVSLDMTITSVLMFFVMSRLWKWALPVVVPLTLAMLTIDLAFLGSILRKVLNGGWIPLVIASFVMLIMGIWRRGRQLLDRDRVALQVGHASDHPGDRVYLVRDPVQIRVASMLLRRTIVVHVNQCHRPRMHGLSHAQVSHTDGLVTVRACYGYLETPDIPTLLFERSDQEGWGLRPETTTFFVIKERLDEHPGMPRWMRTIYGFLSRQALPIAHCFHLPLDQVVEIDHPVTPARFP